jgi:hypothetical protein
MNRRTLCIAALGLGLLVPSIVSAQERERGSRDGRGGGDRAQFQEMRLNRTKERLAVSEEEWQVLKPKIEKVWTAQEALMGGFFRGFSGRGDDNNRPRSATEQASRDLRELLENKDAPADQVAEKLKALREARAKAKAELETAQKALQEVLTPRQEAVLVNAGTLD